MASCQSNESHCLLQRDILSCNKQTFQIQHSKREFLKLSQLSCADFGKYWFNILLIVTSKLNKFDVASENY